MTPCLQWDVRTEGMPEETWTVFVEGLWVIVLPDRVKEEVIHVES
jgi:hypothetical protein